jgi:DNA polymerase III alpha subunit (gram-positive type)
MDIHESWKKFLNEEESKVFLKDLSSGIEKYKDSVWIFFDTETTGLDGRNAQLLEVAAIAVRSDLAEDAGIISQYHTKVNLTADTEKKRAEPHIPKNPRDKSIDDLLKMTQYYSTSAGAKYIEEKEALQGFLNYLKSVSPEGKIVLVAHNAQFDKTFIDARNKLYGLPELKYEIIDTLQIMQEIFYPLLHVVDEMGILPKIKTKFGYSFTLGNISNALDIDVDDWHSALADVKMLIKVTRAVVKLLEKNGHLDVSTGYEVAMKKKADIERWKKKQQRGQ